MHKHDVGFLLSHRKIVFLDNMIAFRGLFSRSATWICCYMSHFLVLDSLTLRRLLINVGLFK